MATTPQYKLWSADLSTKFNIPSFTAAMQSSVERELLKVDTRQIGSRATRINLKAPRLRKGFRFFETDFQIEWVYTGTAWKRIDGVNPGYTNLSSTVNWSSGWKASGTGLRARRVNNLVEVLLNTAEVVKEKFDIPIHGNVTNVTMCTGIPAQFRPASGDFGAFAVGPNGRMWSGYITSGGSLILSNAMPWVNQTGSKKNDARGFSGKAVYHAGSY